MIQVDFEPIRVAIYDWLNQAVNQGNDTAPNATPIFRAEQDTIRPKNGVLYIEYKFLTGLVKIGTNDELLPKLDGNGAPTNDNIFILKGQRNITVSVNAYGENSAGCMAQIQQSLSSPVECSILRAACLAVRNDESFTDVSAMLETKVEERQAFDVVFGFTLETEVDAGKIESVEVENTLPGGKTVIIDKNIGVSIP
jgi:hypothetical protein